MTELPSNTNVVGDIARDAVEEEAENPVKDVHDQVGHIKGQEPVQGEKEERTGVSPLRGKANEDPSQRVSKKGCGVDTCSCNVQKMEILHRDLGLYPHTKAGTLAAHPNSNRARDADSCTQIFTPTCCYSERNTAVKKDTVLTMQLGLTCYKDFLGTNWSKNVKELMREGEIQFGNPESFLAQPLGVGAVLQTVDKHVVFLRRSQKVAEAPGLLDIPGGHPEPKAVCRGVSEESIQVEQLPEEAVVRELFSSVQTEIKDEVNIPLSCLSEPILMGIALNHTSAGRPSAEFYVSCSLTSKEVKKLYWEGGPEASESTDIIFLNKEVKRIVGPSEDTVYNPFFLFTVAFLLNLLVTESTAD
uniref:Nudix (nucleoside diphosphate linked moiety X)-type motif 22 n=1 Tax=Scleropages formosus TaxID=113540 RepID=A0A8C9VQE6_SCLFO